MILEGFQRCLVHRKSGGVGSTRRRFLEKISVGSLCLTSETGGSESRGL